MPLGAAKFSGMGGGQKNPPNGIYVNKNTDSNIEAIISSQQKINFVGASFDDDANDAGMAVISAGGGFSIWVKHDSTKTFEMSSQTTDVYSNDELPTVGGTGVGPINWKFEYRLDVLDGSSLTKTFRMTFANSGAGASQGFAIFELTDSFDQIVDGWNHYAFVRGATTITGSKFIYNGSLFINGQENVVKKTVNRSGQSLVSYLIPLKKILLNDTTINEPTDGNFLFSDSCFQQFVIYGTNFPAKLRSDDTFRNLGSDGTRGGEFTAPGLHLMFNHPFTDITTFDSTASLTLDQTGSLDTTSYDCFISRP